jgi:hypothetical protein
VKFPVIVVFLPYIAAIVLKLAKLLLDRRMMVNALEDLSALPRPSNATFDLSYDLRQVLLKHLSVASLKSTALLTAFISLFNAFTIALQMKLSNGVLLALLGVLVVGICLVGWLIPKKVHTFSKNLWGMTLATRAVLLFCLYDLALAALTYWRLTQT